MKSLLRPRSFIYLGIWSAIGLSMLFMLGNRTRLDLAVDHDRNPVYVQLSDGWVRNNYSIRLRNMETRPRKVILEMQGPKQGVMWLQSGSRKDATTRLEVDVPPDAIQKLRVMVAAPGTGPVHEDFTFATRGLDGDSKGDSDEVVFERPGG